MAALNELKRLDLLVFLAGLSVQLRSKINVVKSERILKFFLLVAEMRNDEAFERCKN